MAAKKSPLLWLGVAAAAGFAFSKGRAAAAPASLAWYAVEGRLPNSIVTSDWGLIGVYENKDAATVAMAEIEAMPEGASQQLQLRLRALLAPPIYAWAILGNHVGMPTAWPLVFAASKDKADAALKAISPAELERLKGHVENLRVARILVPADSAIHE